MAPFSVFIICIHIKRNLNIVITDSFKLKTIQIIHEMRRNHTIVDISI